MEITLRNNTPSPVVVFSVDSSMSKRERKEGEVGPGAYKSFYVPGVPSELRIKDSDGYATIHTFNVDIRRAREGASETQLWQEQGNPNPSLVLNTTGAVTSTSEYSGLWTYRIFDPEYVTGDKTRQKERDLILADGFVFNFRTPTSTTLEGTWGLPDGGLPLDLTGTVRPGVGGEPASFDIVGTGRPGTDTAGWEYR